MEPNKEAAASHHMTTLPRVTCFHERPPPLQARTEIIATALLSCTLFYATRGGEDCNERKATKHLCSFVISRRTSHQQLHIVSTGDSVYCQQQRKTQNAMPSTEVVALTASDSRPPLKDCLSCRVWGGIVHLGFAGFVGSHYNRFHDRFSRSFIALFSLGESNHGFKCFFFN